MSTLPTPDPNTPRAAYESLRDRYTELQQVLAARSRRFSRGRLLTFIAAVLLVIWAMESGNGLAWFLTLATIPTFIALVILHNRVRRAERHAVGRRYLATLGIDRIDRTWEKIPLWPAPPGIVTHPYAYDLDLFGIGSLTQLMGLPGSPHGRSRLVQWLLELPSPEETRARQEAVRELAPQVDYSAELTLAAGGMSSVAPAEVEAFTDWCREIGDTFAPWQRMLFVIVPIALWATALPRLMGIWSVNAWILPAAASFAITFGPWGTRTRNTFTRVFTRDALFHHLPDLLGHIAEHDYTAPRLRQVRAALRRSGDSPRVELERLRRIAHLSDVRRSTAYPIVQLLTLWDQHVLGRLDSWRRRAGSGVPGWIEAAADTEALSSLATLAHDNPTWSYAAIRADVDRIEAKGLGHPLLAPAVRVDNDVTVGPRGTFLLVTGSNMSGKSTLLRSIGTNIVLARVGAPVCAQALTIPVALPCVSMRVQDSIASGVSFFMAELKRVREIVVLAERAQQEGWTCVFLLDEMLHGTNSAERRIAARTVITRLVRAGAIGAVSTHDLQLGAEAELRDLAVRIHFTETVRSDNGRPVMTFDYRIRPGDATSTNALVLLEIMGLKESGS